MKKGTIIVLVGLVVGLLCLGPRRVESKEKPLPELMRIFSTIHDLECNNRSEKWSGAGFALVKIESCYNIIAAKLEPQVDEATDQRFRLLLASLRKRLTAGDAKDIDDAYVQVLDAFLGIMDRYDYPVPPALMMAGHCLKEARADLRQGNLKGVALEMRELGEFKGRIVSALRERGTPSPEGFFDKINSTAVSAGDGRREEVAKTLGELEAYLTTYHLVTLH